MKFRLTNRSRLIILILAAALLLPIYGSWINVSFAAKQPNHKHIYLGKVEFNHHRTADRQDIVILPDQDAASQTVVSIDLPNDQLSVNTAENDNLLFGLSEEYLSPENTFLPPPDHPPRT